MYCPKALLTISNGDADEGGGVESMRLSQLARRPRHHVGAVPEPGRQSPGILDRKPHSITPGAATPTPAGRTVTRCQPTTSRRPVFLRQWFHRIFAGNPGLQAGRECDPPVRRCEAPEITASAW